MFLETEVVEYYFLINYWR